MPLRGLFAALFSAAVRFLSLRNLASDRFGTLAAILGVALGTATVEVVLTLDASTNMVEAAEWSTNPELAVRADTVTLVPVRADRPGRDADAKVETHEDYQVMRSAIALGSLAAFLVGSLIVFFTFTVVVDRRKREAALLRSLGATQAQVAAVFLREALVVGLCGAALGVALTLPLAKAAAEAGITTTGRARIDALVVPWGQILVVAAAGAVTSVLAVLRPVRELGRASVSQALSMRFVEIARAHGKRVRGVTLIAYPFVLLVYFLMRPFFKDALPSLTFFVVEAGLTCVAFLATIVLVPELVRALGSFVMRVVPRAPAAERLLVARRVEQQGDEMAWSVSGVMLVFSLLLALHVATLALTREIDAWAARAIAPFGFVYPTEPRASAAAAEATLPDRLLRAHLSERTPWPSAVHAAVGSELATLAEAAGNPEAAALARKLGPGKIILSTMMANRMRVRVGDGVEVRGRGGDKRLEIVGVADDVGYFPVPGPYRNAKTYGVLDASDYPLIAPYAGPVGSTLILAGQPGERVPWMRMFTTTMKLPEGTRADPGSLLEAQRKDGTARDFVIFDFILALVTVLAAVGVANQLLLSIHGRRRELALYRVLGMTTRQVTRLVLLEGVFIGVLGGLLAAALGVPLGYAAIGALRAVSAFDLSAWVPVRYVVYTFLGGLGTALLASLYPAVRAGKTDSAESVHYE